MSDTTEEDGPDATKVIALDPPIVFNKGKFDTLTLREPMAGEVRKAEGQMRNNMSQEGMRLYAMHLIATVSGLPFPVIEQLPIRVFNDATEYLANFVQAGSATGRI